MNYNHNTSAPNNRWKIVSLILFCLLAVVSIVYMKHSSATQKQLVSPDAPNAPQQQIAVPDTTVDPGILPQTPDTIVPSQLPDTILGRDKRNPYEAGYDDGYNTGCDDGAANTDHANYDDSSTFASSTEKANYARGYREGYAKGFEDGREGKQFNI